MATVMGMHGLHTWALQLRSRTGRDSEMATLNEMITVQGDQWLDAYFDELVKAGPQRGTFADLIKTPGKKREGPKTRGTTVNAAKAKAKIVSANENKENAPLAITAGPGAQKKSTRFQRALLQTREINRAEDPDETILAPVPVKKPSSKPPSVPVPESFPSTDILPSSSLLSVTSEVEASSVAEPATKNGKATKAKGTGKGKNGKGKGKAQKIEEDSQPVVDVEEQSVPHYIVEVGDAPEAGPSLPATSEAIDNDVMGIPSPSHEVPTTEEDHAQGAELTTESSVREQEAPNSPPAPSSFETNAIHEVEHSLKAAPSPPPLAQDAASLSMIEEADETSTVSPPSSQPIVSREETSELIDNLDVEYAVLTQPALPASASAVVHASAPRDATLTLTSLPQSQSLPLAKANNVVGSASAAAVVPIAGANNNVPAPPRKSVYTITGPPVVARGSAGLRSSWLTKALRDDAGAQAVAQGPLPTAHPILLQQRGEKRKSSAVDSIPVTTAMSQIGTEPTNKARKIGNNGEKELVRSTGSILRTEVIQQGGNDILERVKGKVEGLLVRADKDEEKSQPEERVDPKDNEAAAATRLPTDIRKSTKRLSVSDLVSVFEGRGPGSELPPPVPRAPNLVTVDSAPELLRSTTPPNSPPPNFRQSFSAMNVITADAVPQVIAGAVVPVVTRQPAIPVILAPRSPAPPQSQPLPYDTQSSQGTYASGSDFWAVPGGFGSQSTAVSSQFSVWSDIVDPPASGHTLYKKQWAEGIVVEQQAFTRPHSSAFGGGFASQPLFGNAPVHTTSDSAEHDEYESEDISEVVHGGADENMVEEEHATVDEMDGMIGSFPSHPRLENALHDNGVMSQPDPLASSVATLGFSVSSGVNMESSSQPAGLLAQAGAFVSKALGVGIGMPGPAGAKKGKAEPLKSLQLAAAAAKKEQMEKDRKAARAKEMEERRQAMAQRRQGEEKTREEELKKQKAAELERRKREREDGMTLNKASKFVRKAEDEPNKKRKITADVEKKPMDNKKPAPKDGVKKTFKTPTPVPSTLTKSGTKPGLATQGSNSQLITVAKATTSMYPALPTAASSTVVASASVKSVKETTVFSTPGQGLNRISAAQGQTRTSVVTKKSTVKQSFGDGRQPSQALQAQMQARIQAQIQATREEEARVPSELIELPEINSEYSDSEDEDRPRNYVLPDWAHSPELRAQLNAQQSVNPDIIFGAIRPLQMDEIFRTRQSRFRARTSSANWAGQDRLTPQEEMEYARRMGFE